MTFRAGDLVRFIATGGEARVTSTVGDWGVTVDVTAYAGSAAHTFNNKGWTLVSRPTRRGDVFVCHYTSDQFHGICAGCKRVDGAPHRDVGIGVCLTRRDDGRYVFDEGIGFVAASASPRVVLRVSACPPQQETPESDRERANRLADECGALRTQLVEAERERDEVLAENARLRRRVEKMEKGR